MKCFYNETGFHVMYFVWETDVKNRGMLFSACVYSEADFVADSPYIQVSTLLLFLNALK